MLVPEYPYTFAEGAPVFARERYAGWKKSNTIKACARCRNRHVKCDVHVRGAPCSCCYRRRESCELLGWKFLPSDPPTLIYKPIVPPPAPPAPSPPLVSLTRPLPTWDMPLDVAELDDRIRNAEVRAPAQLWAFGPVVDSFASDEGDVVSFDHHLPSHPEDQLASSAHPSSASDRVCELSQPGHHQRNNSPIRADAMDLDFILDRPPPTAPRGPPAPPELRTTRQRTPSLSTIIEPAFLATSPAARAGVSPREPPRSGYPLAPMETGVVPLNREATLFERDRLSGYGYTRDSLSSRDQQYLDPSLHVHQQARLHRGSPRPPARRTPHQTGRAGGDPAGRPFSRPPTASPPPRGLLRSPSHRSPPSLGRRVDFGAGSADGVFERDFRPSSPDGHMRLLQPPSKAYYDPAPSPTPLASWNRSLSFASTAPSTAGSSTSSTTSTRDRFASSFGRLSTRATSTNDIGPAPTLPMSLYSASSWSSTPALAGSSYDWKR